jgi:hypothetical protein
MAAMRGVGECAANPEARGNAQTIELWRWIRSLKDSYDNMNFTPALVSKKKD